MELADYPALYEASDTASRSSQSIYLGSTLFYLVAMVVGALTRRLCR